MPIDTVVGDANVLLSAVIGKAALRVFVEQSVAVHATEFNAEEVEEYLPHLCEKYDLDSNLVALQWKLLPLVQHAEDVYLEHLEWARSRLAGRDPDDAHPLALARAPGLPIWSNDHDLAGHGIDCLPTAKILARLD
jgi:predicted nucleic acid-binding protein